MRVLLCGDEETAALAAMSQKAERTPFVMAEVVRDRDVFNAYRAAARSQTIQIPDGYEVTLTLEDHQGTLCRHISVSVNAPNRLPQMVAVEMLAHECGFVGISEEWQVYTEPLATPGYAAINCVQMVKLGREIARSVPSTLNA